ncbi:hypothetical protein B0J15DRAFT_528862 [Fusarium solani]|uniref:CBM-cenC domain-containing protein n=1 Tax=Fusarium solani TaxID=169388 RepID=A0A9P9GP47_FUSSL|nr:uncharacterized protein B0J15DRAFT_528862 [Fusarium solani]KAH7243153.1 hypothetical protein B0J15DRAFT_528862 [Fusarium solani]
MRTVIPLLQLLALAHQAAASVCRPRVTSSSVSVESVTTSASTAASSTVSSTGSESTTWSSTETASSSTETVSLSTTETASSSTESASLSTTESATISTTETASLSTTDSSTVVSTTSSASESISSDSSTITSSTLFTSTTSTAEASSTTSSVPEGPPELLINRGFEDKDSLSPWQQYQSWGTLAIATDESHSGGQSAHLTWSSPLTPRGQYDYNTGVVQPVPASKVVADTQYEFSAWVKLSPSMRCQNFYIACSIGDGFMPGSFQATAVPGVGGWLQLKTTCQWSQIWLNAGPGVAVIGQCTEADYYVDDASFKLVV